MSDSSQPRQTRSPSGSSELSSRRQLGRLSDGEVLEILKTGETSALTELYDRYGTLVYRLAFRMLGNTQEAEDLTQDIFLKFYQRNTYDPKRGSLSSFLMTFTRSRAIDRLRSRQSKWRFFQKISHREVAIQGSDLPLESASQSEVSERVRDAMTTLPEAQRQVLELAYYQGLSQSEIASHLDMPLGTVKTRSRQGLLKLRNVLTDLVERP